MKMLFWMHNTRLILQESRKKQRFAAETQVLREYAVHKVQEVYQSELGIRQNHIMENTDDSNNGVPAAVTIAGWYGMNFSYMPELSWRYGYPMAAGISALVLVLLLWLFRRKGFCRGKDIVHHLSEINCIKKMQGDSHALVFLRENQMKNSRKIVADKFIQLTRIKSWDNIEKLE